MLNIIPVSLLEGDIYHLPLPETHTDCRASDIGKTHD